MKSTPRGRASSGLLVVLLLAAGAGCSGSADERRWDIYELAADPTPENVSRIRAMLDDPDRDIRATALNKLVGLGVEDAEPLALDGLRDEDGFVRSIAAKRLGDLGNPAHAALLVDILLQDPDPRARETAAQALELVGGDVALAGLIRGLDDPMSRVRLSAATGVRKLGPAPAKASLARLVLEDSSWEVRVQAAGALGQCGDPEMISVLEAAATDESEFVRSAAAHAAEVLRAVRTGAGTSAGAR